MTVTRGKVHKFVGMDILFKENKTVEIKMVEYITGCFEAFGEPLKKERILRLNMIYLR